MLEISGALIREEQRLRVGEDDEILPTAIAEVDE